MLKKVILCVLVVSCYSAESAAMEQGPFQPQIYLPSGQLEPHRSISVKDLKALQASLEDEDDGALRTNLRSSDNITPLELAISNNYIDAMKVLLAKGADPLLTRDSDGCTAFHVAAQGGSLDVINALIIHAQFPETRNSLQEAAASILAAKEYERGELLEVFAKNLKTQHIGILKRKALQKGDSHNRVPRLVAVAHKNDDCAEFLDAKRIEQFYGDAIEQRYLNDLTMTVS